MQVNGMLVATVVVHGKAISLAALHGEHRSAIGRGLVIERFAIDGPAVVAATASRDLLEFQVDGLVGCCGRTTAPQYRLIPRGPGGTGPKPIASSVLIR